MSSTETTVNPIVSGLGRVVVTNYMWDQSNDFIKIYIEIDKNCSINSNEIQINYPNKRSVSVVFGKYKFTKSKLFDEIDSEKSYHKLTTSGRLIIYLKKTSSKHWSSIEEKDNQIKKTFDDNKQDATDDPSTGLMKLMVLLLSLVLTFNYFIYLSIDIQKQMYDEGDDDMKRNIAKSWYESRQKATTDVDIKSDDSLNI